MITASAQTAGKVNVSSVHLANLRPNVRSSFFQALKQNCCPELKDADVEKAMKQALSIESFSVEHHGDGFVAFKATLPNNGGTLVTSRLQLQRLF